MKQFKALLLTSALVMTTGSASANTNFNGTFLGAQLGGTRISGAKSSLIASTAVSFKSSPGFTESKRWNVNGGVLAGHRKPLASRYVGGATIGIDFEGTQYKNSITARSAQGKSQRRFIVNALGQLGYPVHRNMMPYVTFGLSYAQFKFTNSDSGGSSSKLKNKLGWAGGVGVSHSFNPKISADLQYLYTKYSRSAESTLVTTTSYTTFNPRAYHAVTVGVKVNM